MKKIIKKIILGSLIIAGTCFISCSNLFNKELETDNYDTVKGTNSTSVNVGNTGNAFVANFNFENYNTYIDDFNIKKIKSRQAIKNEDIKGFNPLEANISIKNEEVLKDLKLNISRKADQEDIKASLNTLTYNLGDLKKFWMYKDRDMNTSELQTAECKFIGEYCIIWYIESSDVELENDVCEKLGSTFDKIFELETKLIGSNIYKTKISEMLIDPSDKIEIVFGDLLNDANLERNTEIYGYFKSSDLFNNEYYKDSNKGQIIYIDTYNFNNFPNIIYSTIIHEFNHLLNFCVKQEKGLICDTWFTEMLAMLAEDAFEDFIDVEYQDSPKVRLLKYFMEFGYVESPIDWYNLQSEDILYSYAATYALGAYLVRNFGGLELLHNMATNSFVDLTSIENALQKCGYVYKSETDELNSFNVVYKKIPLILINDKEIQNEDLTLINKKDEKQYHTLNRTWKDSSYPELSFTAINIRGTYNYKYYDENRKLQNGVIDTYPIFLDPEENYGYSQIKYAGYAIYYLGNNLKSFYIDNQNSTYFETYYPEY